MRNYKFFCLTLVFLFVSCQRELGEYVYIDTNGILHIDNNCKHITERYKAKPVSFVRTDNLHKEDYELTCSHCVNDFFFREIQNIVKDNLANEAKKRHQLKLFYNHLEKVGENRWIDFDDFYEYMEDSDDYQDLIIELSGMGYKVSDWFHKDTTYNSHE